MDQGRTGRDARQRLTVGQAAQVLGLTVDAVRSRIKRNAIAHTREGGRVYVLLAADQGTVGHDQGTGQATDQGAGKPPEDRTAELIATLREQLQAERQAHAEARRIIAGLVERIPQLEAPTDSPPAARQSPEPGEEQQGRGDVPPDDTAQRQAPWWRRIIGG